MITIEHVHKVFGRGKNAIVALDDVSLEVPRGQITGVLGQSGAGKSTLIRCVNLLERPTAGRIFINDQEMTALKGRSLRLARQHIGMIFQRFNLLSSRTVAENIAFPLEIVGYSASRRNARVRELLALVGLEERARAYPHQLSGGQMQRVGIARALANSPTILLSDEATSALDPQTTTTILDLLRDLNRKMELTILLITHEMSVVRQICQHVAILEQGQVIEQGEIATLALQPASRLSQSLFVRPRPDRIVPGGVTVATFIFAHTPVDEPIVTTFVRRFDLEVHVLNGSVERLGDQDVTHLQMELKGEHVLQALQYAQELGIQVEVHH